MTSPDSHGADAKQGPSSPCPVPLPPEAYRQATAAIDSRRFDNAADVVPHRHLDGIIRVLGGDRARRLGWRAGDPVPMLGGRTLSRFAAVPSLRTPRLLLPLDCPAALYTSLRQHARCAASPTARWAARLLMIAAVLRVAAPLMRQRLTVITTDDIPRQTPLHRFLGDLLGRHDLSLALRLTAGRPNGRPVVQAMAPDGAVLAYAKFGWEPLTRRLIRHEGRMLMALAAPTRGTPITIPTVLHARPWAGLETLVVAPVPPTGHTPRDVAEVPATALRCLAGIGQARRSTLGDSRFWQRMKARTAALAPLVPPPTADLLATAARTIERRWGAEDLALGLTHGDWVPPNMAVRADGGISLWDWERGGFNAPLGIDSMQFILFQALRRHTPGPALVRKVRRRGTRPLEVQGVPARHVTLLSALSLLDTVLWLGEAFQAGRHVESAPQIATALQVILDDKG